MVTLQGQFNGGRMVMLTFGQYKGGSMVMLQRWSVTEMIRVTVTEVISLIQGEWSCYRGGQCSGRRMVKLQRWSI